MQSFLRVEPAYYTGSYIDKRPAPVQSVQKGFDMKNCKKAVEVIVNRNTITQVSAECLGRALKKAAATRKFSKSDPLLHLEQFFELPGELVLEFLYAIGIEHSDFPALIEAAAKEGFKTDALERYVEEIA